MSIKEESTGERRPTPVELNNKLRQVCDQLPRNAIQRGDLTPDDLGLPQMTINEESLEETGLSREDIMQDIAMCFVDMSQRMRRETSEIRQRIHSTLNEVLSLSNTTEPCNWYGQDDVNKYLGLPLFRENDS